MDCYNVKLTLATVDKNKGKACLQKTRRVSKNRYIQQ